MAKTRKTKLEKSPSDKGVQKKKARPTIVTGPRAPYGKTYPKETVNEDAPDEKHRF